MKVFSANSAVLRGIIAVVGLVAIPGTAEAHLNTTGLGPVYDGLVHFVITLEDFVPVLALALFAGMRSKQHGRRVLFLLPAAWLTGGLLGLNLNAYDGPLLPAVLFLLFGVLVAVDARLSQETTTLLAVLLGLCQGLLNGATIGQPFNGSLALLGMVGAVFILIAFVSAFVSSMQRPWARIGVRVVGSWIAACGLLLIGWASRNG